MNLECRICLNTPITESISILVKCELKRGIKTIEEMIFYCSEVVITMEDALPRYICMNCFENLKVAYNFKSLCIESNSILKDRLTSIIFEAEEIVDNNDNNDEYETLQNDINCASEKLDDKSKKSKDIEINCSNPTNSSKHNCKNCSEVFELLSELKQHNCTNDTPNTSKNSKGRPSKWPQSCPDCGKIFHTKKSKASHSKNLFNQCMKGKAKSFQCFICNKRFQKLYMKEDHIKSFHSNDEQFSCKICKCQKKTAASLDSHIKYHFKSKEYCCERCGKAFETAIRLKTHLEGFHSLAEKYCCDICGHRVKGKSSLRDHINSKHLNKRQYKCKECGDAYSYTCKTVYLQHMYRNHNVEPPIRCEACNAGFTHPHELKRHKNKFGKCKQAKTKEFVRIIGEDNKFLWKGPKTVKAAIFSSKKGEVFCKYCNKKFTTTSNLMIHYRVKHQGLYYKCDECDNVYSSPRGLNQHKQTKHLNNYPFSCKICGKKFPQKTPLERHEIIHTDLKPFECNLCKKKFNDNGSCRRHIKTVHKNLNITDINSEIVKVDSVAQQMVE